MQEFRVRRKIMHNIILLYSHFFGLNSASYFQRNVILHENPLKKTLPNFTLTVLSQKCCYDIFIMNFNVFYDYVPFSQEEILYSTFTHFQASTHNQPYTSCSRSMPSNLVRLTSIHSYIIQPTHSSSLVQLCYLNGDISWARICWPSSSSASLFVSRSFWAVPARANRPSR